jgi:hypothetical protein
VCLAWCPVSRLLFSCRAAPSNQLATFDVDLNSRTPTPTCHLPPTVVSGLACCVLSVVFVQSRTFNSAGDFDLDDDFPTPKCHL